MKKLSFSLGVLCVLGLVVVFATRGGAQEDGLAGSIGIMLNDDLYCNDYFLVANELSHKLYECHGYEYGCGLNNITLYGTAHVHGGYAYFNFTALYDGGDYGQIGTNMVVIDLSTNTGTDTWAFFWGDAGVPITYGGVSNLTLVAGPDPAGVPYAASPNKAVR